jgi:hypothetical protein
MKMPRPALGHYSLDRKGDPNGTVNNFRKWRRWKMKIAKQSRRINRS